jgi:two-component system, cell cycle sensor histidine kinase and response regulator CckA
MTVKPTYEKLEALHGGIDPISRHLLDLSPFSIFISRIGDGRYLIVNEAFCRNSGYAMEEIVGRTARDLGLFENPADRQRMVDAIRQHGEVREFEIRLRSKKGVLYRNQLSARPIAFGGEACLLGITTFTEAITQARHALRQSEESYRGLLELAPDAITITGIEDGRYYQVNEAFCRKTGYSVEETIGRTPSDLNLYVDPADRKRMIEVLCRQGRVDGMEIRYRMKDGSCVDHLVSARPIRFKDQDCLLLIAKDIGLLKQAQDSLRLSEDKYRTILETMEEGYYEVDLKGNYTYHNEASRKLHGYAAEELMGKNYRDYLHPDQADEIKRLFNRIYRTGVPSTILDHTIVRNDGSLRMVEMSAYPLRGPSGEIAGFWGISRDRTERKQAEIALQESEGRLRLIFDNANEGIYINQAGRIKFPNPKTAAICGYSQKELNGLPFVDLVHPEDKEALYTEQLGKLESSHRPGVFSFRILNKARETLWVELSTVGITWEGRPAALNFLRDITPQKRMEAQLLQAQKMEAVGTLAGGIAHDFNNLLMGIQGNTSLALMDIGPDHPHYEKLKSIEKYVKAGSDLTIQLLGAARGGKYEVKPTDLNKVVAMSADLFGRTRKEIAIHQRLHETLWPVEVDRGQIEQVLLNLCVNAWHAMPEGGDLFLESRNVVLDDYYVRPYGVLPGRYVKLSVTDTGIGIDPRDQKRIFDPFFTTRAMGRGTGLGLASTYGIIANHGGIITVYSEKGAGSTFNIYLPATEKAVVENEAPRAGVIAGKETVLLVDDEKGIIEVGKLILERLGYTVFVAHGGHDAVELYDRHKDAIDLVMLDMVMPGMSGSDTFDALKQINPDIKVLLSSGYSINGQAKNILDRGCKGFIQKPFGMKDLSIKLRQILDSRK